MEDPRYKKLAEILVDYSTKVKKGETVVVSSGFDGLPLAKEIAKLCWERDAFPRTHFGDESLTYLRYKYSSKEALAREPLIDLYEMKHSDVWIGLMGSRNTNTLNNVDSEKIVISRKAAKKVYKERVRNTRWNLCCYSSTGMAQNAFMSLEEFEDFLFGATLLDWEKLSKEMDPLVTLLTEGKEVRLIGKETDITLGIEGRKGLKSDGTKNMPGGEVFTSPVRTTVEGHIYFDFPARQVKQVKDIRLWFKKGKVVKATASLNEDYLHQAMATDKLSSSVGELGIGTNYGITKFIDNTLFDEKIGGTIHLALGAGMKECGGDDRSAIHWDLIKDMREGGEIYIDGKLMQKDGKMLIKGWES